MDQTTYIAKATGSASAFVVICLVVLALVYLDYTGKLQQVLGIVSAPAGAVPTSSANPLDGLVKITIPMPFSGYSIPVPVKPVPVGGSPL